MTEEEANQVRSKNEEIRKERDASADLIATKLAVFKRDFLSAPLRAAMNAVLNKTKPPAPCQIDYRKDERFWVFPEETDVSVTFEVNFHQATDQSLARIFLLELNTAKVVNAPAVAYHDKQFPESVTRLFPGAMTERTSNGSMTFKVSENIIKKGLEVPLSQLIGFR